MGQSGSISSNECLIQRTCQGGTSSMNPKRFIEDLCGRPLDGAVRPGAWCSSGTCWHHRRRGHDQRIHAPMGRAHPRSVVRSADPRCSWVRRDVRVLSTPTPASTPQRAVRRMPSPPSSAREKVSQTAVSSECTIGTRTRRPLRAYASLQSGLTWLGPDARDHTFLDRFVQQGCWKTERFVPHAPTWNRQHGATAGSRACADTDGSRHGPEHTGQRNQRLDQVTEDRRTHPWPAVCVPQYTNLKSIPIAACRPHQLAPLDSAPLPSLRRVVGADSPGQLNDRLEQQS